MDYKTVILIVFVLLMLVLMPFIFYEGVANSIWGWLIMGIIGPGLVVCQVVSILRADAPAPIEFKEGTYENP